MALFSRAERAADAALLDGLAVDDEEAAAAFVRRFSAAVYGLALSITRDRAPAEDVSQEVFVRAWRAAASYDVRRASVLTWLLSITRNAAIDAVRLRRAIPTDAELLEQVIGETLRDPPARTTPRCATSRPTGRWPCCASCRWSRPGRWRWR